MTEITTGSAAGGQVAVHWHPVGRSVRLDRIELEPQARRRQTTTHHPKIDALLTQLSSPARRSGGTWPLQAAGIIPSDDFATQVRLALATEVAAGRVISYGELARVAGYPGAARAVGSVMRRNQWPLLVPCHRVVTACGSLGGFQGGCLGSTARKRALLIEEGVTFTAADRVAATARWVPSV